MMENISRRAKWGLGIAAIPIAIYTLLPIIWIFSLSLKSPGELSNTDIHSFFPKVWTITNYREILTGDAKSLFLPALRNSIGIALIATLISVVLATAAAYAIARLKFPGRKIVLTTALGVAIFPVVSIVTPLFNLWRQIGLYNTWPGLVIPYLTLTLPLSIWTLSAFFRQIPWDLEEAASIDGCSEWQSFTQVIAPLAVPGIFTTAIIAFFAAWNDFVYSSSLTSTSAARTVPAALAFFTGSSQFVSPIGAICAASIVVTVPVVALVLVFQRRIVSGLTAGAVKG